MASELSVLRFKSFKELVSEKAHSIAPNKKISNSLLHWKRKELQTM